MSRLDMESARLVMNKHMRNSERYIYSFFLFAITAFLLIIGNDAYAGARLKGNVPDLCYECHKELKKNLQDEHLHFLFEQGKCSKCHNPHVSNIKGLMNDEVDSVCLKCHDRMRKLIENADMHSALRDGACMDCHSPHSSENNNLLLTAEKELCQKCHEDLKTEFDKPYVCLPFKQGKCSSCHDSHASAEDNLLNSRPNELCQKCHAPKCTAGDVPISSIVKKSDCTTCHSGHASNDKGLLGPYGHSDFLSNACEKCHDPIKAGEKVTTKLKGKDLCFSCHKQVGEDTKYVEDDIHVRNSDNPCNICHDHHASSNKNLTKKESKLCIECHEATEKRTVFMEKALKSIKCAPIKDRKCFACHIPMHSDRPLNYSADPMDMCARCHEAEHKITHPLGKGVIDPRDGSELTCLSCHSMHGATSEFMLTFDRKRTLCIKCHKM